MVLVILSIFPTDYGTVNKHYTPFAFPRFSVAVWYQDYSVTCFALYRLYSMTNFKKHEVYMKISV